MTKIVIYSRTLKNNSQKEIGQTQTKGMDIFQY